MAQQKKELFSKWRDWTQKNRNWILYAAGILTLFGLAGGAAMLPEQVALQAVQEGQTAALVDKEMALGATGALTVFFGLLISFSLFTIGLFLALADLFECIFEKTSYFFQSTLCKLSNPINKITKFFIVFVKLD